MCHSNFTEIVQKKSSLTVFTNVSRICQEFSHYLKYLTIFSCSTGKKKINLLRCRFQTDPDDCGCVSGFWKVPGAEEESEGSSSSGFSEGAQFSSQHDKHVEPSSLRRPGLPRSEGGALSRTTPAETLRPVRGTFGEDRPHLQVTHSVFLLL